MKSRDLDLFELVTFNDGNIDLYGRRLVLHSSHAVGQFSRDIIAMLGEDQARRVFTRFGYFWGHADAAAMKRVLDWDDPTEMLKAGLKTHAMTGVVRPEMQSLTMDPESGQFHMEVTWHGSCEAEEHLTRRGRADHPICWQLVGYASGYATFCMGRNVYFIETTCRGAGDRTCAGVGKDQDSWGDEIKPHLHFFEADDIKSRISEISRELKKKTKQLIRQRKSLEMIRHTKSEFFVEGRSKSLEEVHQISHRIAQFETSVLITGETGVGKEVLARYIHANSPRVRGPFLAVNCGALTETLLESDLFGHRRGSFTGAVADRVGLFEQAARGTIFLDEIGDITPALQLKLLRVIQEREIMRVGDSTPRKIDVRILAATNKDLEKSVIDGSFREDLLYRLKVIEINIPPLRKRREDILPLTRFLIDKLAKKYQLPNLRLDATCVDFLISYPWPGNVRELENALERMVVLSRDGILIPENLPINVLRQKSNTFSTGGDAQSLASVEDAYISHVLKQTGGNRTRAAQILGIGQATLWRKLKARKS